MPDPKRSPELFQQAEVFAAEVLRTQREATDRPDAPPRHDPRLAASYAATAASLHQHVARTFPRLPRNDIEDVVADALEALLRALIDQKPIGDAGAWLLGAAVNKAADRHEHASRLIVTEDVERLIASEEASDPDGRLRRALEAKHEVRAAVRLAFARKQWTVARVALAWLDHYETHERAPTLRELGAAAEISHEGARQALARFHDLVVECQSTR
jgi:DNA-directed RNA polymerase specialized sigma24 family protein